MLGEVWWSCGQANNGWSVEQFAGIRQDPSPVAQQVMAFIEDDQANAGILESSECFDGRAMQRSQGLAADGEFISNNLLVPGQPGGVVLGISFLQILDPELALLRRADLIVFDQVLDPVLEGSLFEIVSPSSWQGHRLVGQRVEQRGGLGIGAGKIDQGTSRPGREQIGTCGPLHLDCRVG